MRLSVIIANYNYAHFVAQAIESALGLDWDDLEVIVVDDGSTDESRAVIDRYADRVQRLYGKNSGQREAANRGYAISTGEIVIFLDSDDVLPVGLPQKLMEVWSPRVSKVQFQMQRIGPDGAPVGSPFPSYNPVPSAADLRRWIRSTSAYPTPPGSGNAYARWFLERLMPIPDVVGDFLDSAVLATAPLLGEVVSVPGVTVGYRQHAANDSFLLAEPSRFAREITRARARWCYANELTNQPGQPVDETPLFRSRELLQFRVANQKLAPGSSPLPGDGPLRIARDIAGSIRQPGPESTAKRFVIAGWCLATLVAPQPLAGRLLERRYGRPR